MKKKLEALKNGLDNGLKGQLLYSKMEDFGDEEWVTESKFSKGSVWTIAGYADSDLHIPLGEGEIDGFLWRNENTYVNFRHGILPCFFPLSHLTKPIRVSGYNDGKEFVPIVVLLRMLEESWFREASKRYQDIEYRMDGMRAKAFSKLMATKSIDLHTSFTWNWATWITQELDKMHINWRNLDPSDYIDASVSGVYNPKK